MADVWLEVKSCEDEGATELDRETVLRLPTLSEAMKVAEGAEGDVQTKGGLYWEYSVRLAEQEIDEMSSLFSGGAERDEGPAVTCTIDIKYNGRSYSLALISFKE